jgi:hypothetical protein
MNQNVTTMKIRPATLKRLKLLAVLTDATMLDTLDRLIEAELARVQSQQQKEPSHAGDTGL